MKFEYENISFNYVFINNNKQLNTIILPGWMNTHKTYECLYKTIMKYSNIFVLDFPGFKVSNDPIKPVDLNYYVNLLYLFIENLNITNVILFGHSFGARVAIKYQSIYNNALYLILTSAAGIKTFNFIKWIKIRTYKFKKILYKQFNKEKYNYLIHNSGSKDYVGLSDVMKKTFINIINEDLKANCKLIKSPTLLIWGCEDIETRISCGKLMNKLIKSSTLIKIKSAGHFPFKDNIYLYSSILDKFYEYIVEELLLQ